MGKTAALLLVLVLVVSGIAAFLPVKGEYRKIVVPVDYSTIQEAIDAASEGDTIFVKKGIYQEEKLEIGKSLSLVGEDAEETEIYFVPPLVDRQILGAIIQVRSTALLIYADNVGISGLTLKTKEYVPIYDMDALSANGDGIEIIDNIMGKDFNLNLKGDQLNVIGNSLSTGMQARGSNQTITRNVILAFASYGNWSKILKNVINGPLTLRGSHNLIDGNSFVAIRLMDSHSNLITNNTVTFMHVGYEGLACTNNTISKNSIIGPDNRGILMSAGSNNLFHDNLVYNYTDGYGVAIGGNGLVAENNVFYRNLFVNNDLHVSSRWEVSGAGNFWDNGEEGNFWDNYTGVDSNMDGIGDVPYMVEGYKWVYEVDGVVVDELVSFVFGVDNYPLMFPSSIEDFSSELLDEVQLPTPYPEPIPTPYDEPQQTEQDMTAGAILAVTSIVVFLGLLFYSIKRR